MPIETLPHNRYVALDTLPDIAAARDTVRREAWAMVAGRKALHEAGAETTLPLPIDALSTAEGVLEAEQTYGEDSPEYTEHMSGLRLDCRRLVAEWRRKLKPEYFEPSRHFFDAATGDFYSHGLSIRQMTENALQPFDDDPEEEARRVNERVEDATPQIVQKIGGFALHGVGIRTISECTDKAISDYQSDMKAGRPHDGYNGYVPEIEKVMIRDIRLEAVSGDRLEEQVGLPGIYINHYVIQQALARREVAATHLDKTGLHGTQMLAQDDLFDFVRLLDEVASEEWRTNIFMGEEVAPDYQKDYEQFRSEAITRQQLLDEEAGTVAMFVLDLANDGFDKRKAPAMVEDFVKKMLLNVAKQDNDLAYHMFDHSTAVGLQKVAELEAMGRDEEAFALMQKVEEAAPGGGFCSGGSCGLESVNLASKEGKELKDDLKAEAGDTIVKDHERACKKCGQKKVAYAYNSRKVNKYCQGCKAFESKISVKK